MALKIFDLLSIVLSALVLGGVLGALAGPEQVHQHVHRGRLSLAVVHRMDRNLSSVMTVLMPLALLATIPVLFISYNDRDGTFFLTAAGFGLFVLTLLVTGIVEVPVVKKIRPCGHGPFRHYRETGNSFVIVGSGSTSSEWPGSIAGLTLLVAGAIFQNG